MQELISYYSQKTKQNKQMQYSFRSVAVFLSLVVMLCVFWHLKLTGITLAGEAFCGIPEHVHNEECIVETLICELEESDEHTHIESCYEMIQECVLEEHIHIESCYCDVTADLETADDWEMSFADISRGSTTAENIVLLAQSQLGCAESEINFEVGADGVRRGITRYGQWYGNPYGDWSTMFASFCLYYAGAEDVPMNAGAESMRLEWEAQGLYRQASEYAPQVGNLVFLQKDGGNSVAIITEVFENDMKVIEGDVEGCVAELTYSITSEAVLGYGVIEDVSEFAVYVETPQEAISLAAATNFNTSMLTSSNRFVIYTVSDGITYAIDGAGNAVQVYVDDNGKIRADVDNPDMLLWTFSRYNNNSTAIQNVGSGRYLHPYFNSNSDNGITTPGRWGTTVNASGKGVVFSHSAYIGFDKENKRFYMTRTQGQNAQFLLGMSSPCTVWLDGTNGGLMTLGGSEDRSYTAYTDSTLTLPTSWKSPVKYSYVLKGWYDVTNNKYYAPGDKVTVTGNMVFYADWKAASYDVGQFNSKTTNTISTNKFIRTRLFDYNALLNVVSERANVNVSSSSHSETWQLLTSGNNPYNGNAALNFILRDWDRGNEDISYPKGHNDRNNPTNAGVVYPGLYTNAIREVFFNPDFILPGKEYLGEADYLFQLCEEPGHNHYGYYYYNSERNAASYNQTEQRFYVYDYLECTRDSLNNGNEGKYSDFLPFNSPYTNTNGKNPITYSYNGVEGEYVGTTHYMYDSRYNDNDNTTNNIGTNFLFGMSLEIDFYLPNKPGVQVVGGGYGNKDVYGEDMHFRFTGDDDVWIFVDDTMVLDLGGLHGRETGDINFATGEVTINGVRNDNLSNALKTISAGEHTLYMYYLERGSSMSNCAIYFNLAPRFDFTIQKEDVLTKEILNGAQFSVYTDKECKVPAQLWTSKEAHDNGAASTNVFTVENGIAHMWGMGAGNVYYIKETKPPTNTDYAGLSPNGIIELSFDKTGTASYKVDVIDTGSGVSPGFTVHGFRIDTETQQAYIVATNAPKWVNATTSVQAVKQWNDTLEHSNEEITVYLTVTDKDGTVRRLQEAVLSDENGWMIKWDNLPKYEKDGKTLVKYGVDESYVPGYYSTVESVTGEVILTQTKWTNKTTFERDKVYLLKNADGLALSTQRVAEDTGYMWVTEEVAQKSQLALWTASLNGRNVRLTNQAGQTITFYYGNGSPTDFFALNQHVDDKNRKQYFTCEQTSNGIRLKYGSYYLSKNLNDSQKFANSTESENALLLLSATEETTVTKIPIKEQGFLIQNTPLAQETSVTVEKQWSIPVDMNASVYEKEQVTIRLLANGIDTGRTVTLNLKNGWIGVFQGLPYKDSGGNVIKYTVQEVNKKDIWSVNYGVVGSSGGTVPNYSTVVTNTYKTGVPMLPETGSYARMMYMLCGASIMLGTLIYGISFKRKLERRVK